MKKGLFVSVAIATILVVLLTDFAWLRAVIWLPAGFIAGGGSNVFAVFVVIILSLIGIAIPIFSLFSVRSFSSETIFSKKIHKIYFIVNIFIILVSLFLLFTLVVPSFDGGMLDDEVRSRIQELFD